MEQDVLKEAQDLLEQGKVAASLALITAQGSTVLQPEQLAQQVTILQLHQHAAAKQWHKVLGVGRSASAEEVTAGYRRLAKQVRHAFCC